MIHRCRIGPFCGLFVWSGWRLFFSWSQLRSDLINFSTEQRLAFCRGVGINRCRNALEGGNSLLLPYVLCVGRLIRRIVTLSTGTETPNSPAQHFASLPFSDSGRPTNFQPLWRTQQRVEKTKDGSAITCLCLCVHLLKKIEADETVQGPINRLLGCGRRDRHWKWREPKRGDTFPLIPSRRLVPTMDGPEL